ncbi:MAG TPA: four-helix bundle copper-binding protein [Gemmataceae bacterium]|nr:four-helix bundle copper-binding protein [Gemmataceae bacterium]
MSRVLYLATITLTAAALVIGRPAAAAEEQHGEHFVACAKACASCQLHCDSCFTHCLSLLAMGQKDHAKTARLCADCAECCKLAATLSARQSPLAGPACECCAKCCDECEAACAKHPDDKHMAQCAKACKDCAKACRDMLKSIK